jgi:hypothetical protein
MMRMAIIAVALIATILPAAAEMSAKQMIESFTKEDTTTIKVYFRGLHEAFAWSNTALKQQGKLRLYCEPASITLTDEQSFDIMRRAVVTDPKLGTNPAGLALLLSLQVAFPCPKGSP